MIDIKIIYKNNKPYGIRDKSGFLFFFSKISKFDNQESRYKQEILEQFELAESLCEFLKLRPGSDKEIE